MEKTFTYNYPRPAFTADMVVFARDASGAVSVLLIRRGAQPFAGSWALPGGFVNESEQSVDAAKRELNEETGLCLSGENVSFVGIYDSPNRDPRGWTISAAYAVVLDAVHAVVGLDDASEALWFPLSNLPTLAFDHKQIIDDAMRICAFGK